MSSINISLLNQLFYMREARVKFKEFSLWMLRRCNKRNWNEQRRQWEYNAIQDFRLNFHKWSALWCDDKRTIHWNCILLVLREFKNLNAWEKFKFIEIGDCVGCDWKIFCEKELFGQKFWMILWNFEITSKILPKISILRLKASKLSKPTYPSI